MHLRPALALLLAIAALPAAAQDMESHQPASTVSLGADPQLSDGRLVLRIAAQNRGAAPVAFGPANVRVVLAGKPVALIPVEKLIADVRTAAGLDPGTDTGASTEAPAMVTTGSGQKDVSGYTGGMGMTVASSRPPAKKHVSPDAVAAAEQQIAGLRAGILADRTLAPGELAAGQLVTEKLNLRGRDRTVVVTVTVGGDTHSFKFEVPRG